MTDVTALDIRCPVGPRKLLAKLVQRGEQPVVVPGNLMEFACTDCRNRLRREGVQVTHVLHRYDILGNLVETDVVR